MQFNSACSGLSSLRYAPNQPVVIKKGQRYIEYIDETGRRVGMLSIFLFHLADRAPVGKAIGGYLLSSEPIFRRAIPPVTEPIKWMSSSIADWIRKCLVANLLFCCFSQPPAEVTAF